MTTIDTPHPSADQIRCMADQVEAAVGLHDGVTARIGQSLQVVADYKRIAADPAGMLAAALKATEAVDLLEPVVEDLRHALREAATAHAHHGSATHTAWREKARADAAEDLVARLTAELDQARAKLRDRAATP